MNKMQAHALGKGARAFRLSAIAAATSLVISTPAMAFQWEKGELSGAWDTTITYGVGVRVEDRDSSIIGVSNGGEAFSVNYDDGNLNFDKGDVFSNAVKVSSDIDINYKDYGAFFRVNALYDQVLANDEFADRPNGVQDFGGNAVRPLSDDAQDLAAQRVELFDAFVYGDFELTENNLGTFKLGNQVISWGESTFIQNSINAINPADVSKLRVPGSELKEALLPIPLASASLELTENTSVEAFYQLAWEPFRVDPTGSYFAAQDFAGEGGFDHGVLLRFGQVPDSANPVADNEFRLTRAADNEARDDGQFGFAYRVYAPELNDTEFGFYFMNYHSRLPLLSARTATAARVQAASNEADLYPSDPTRALGAYINELVTGDGAAQYFLDYPEDIQLYGFSFNTTLGTTGIALQGEISHRQDVPLQLDDVELLFAGIGASSGSCSASGVFVCNAIDSLAAFNQAGGFHDEDTIIPGYQLLDVSQIQATATKAIGNVLGANRAIVIGEVGFNYVHSFPDKDDRRFDAPGTFISANRNIVSPTDPSASLLHGDEGFEDNGNFADEFSWGYRLAGRLEYLNALGPVNLLPKFSFSHDVEGISPGPGGSFIEGRNALTLGVDFDYQNEWSGGIAYTAFNGAGQQNLLNDRDFVAANVKYSF